MKITNGKAEGVKLAYIGGGSRGWAWTLMTDLASEERINGDVYLYDIDYEAAKKNEVIGGKFNSAEGAKSNWGYHATKTIDEALSGADFVIISILPATFDEMESDVHLPEKYGIYQSVGDTTGPGGIVRALRTIPMFEYIAEKIKEHCPDAWVINYTNPMALCVGSLYRAFPEIKAIGCCHEVFGTQALLAKALEDITGIKCAHRSEIKVNVVGTNHFTWITKANYQGMDLYPIWRKFCEKYIENGYIPEGGAKKEWDKTEDDVWQHTDKVKMDLFLRFGVIAAAGDRHLAEFCPGKWYLENPETVRGVYHFNLTPVSYRKNDLKIRLQKSEDYYTGKLAPELRESGEEGVQMLCALIGLGDMVTNVNIPNRGQIPNLPIGAIVETNAAFRAGSITPIMAGNIPTSIYPLISRVVGEQEMVLEAAMTKNLELAFEAFCCDPLVTISHTDAKVLFNDMIENTKEYLSMYGI